MLARLFAHWQRRRLVGVDPALRSAVEEAFVRTLQPVELLLPYSEGGRLAELHDVAGDLQRDDTPDGVHVTARLPAAIAARYARFAVNGAGVAPDARA